MDTHLSPPPAPLGHAPGPAPAAGPYSIAIATAAWAVILACVGCVAYLSWRSAKRPARVQATEDVQLLMSSRVIVGMFHHQPKGNTAAAVMSAQAVEKLSITAGPKQQLLLVSVIGEVEGRQAAEAALDRCARTLKDDPGRADIPTLRTIYSGRPGGVSPEQRAALIADEGWFGKLALSFGRPDDDPQRAAVLHSATRAAIAGIAFEAVVGLSMLAGLALLITAIVLIATGRLHRCYGPASFQTTAFLEGFALYLPGFLIIEVLAQRLLHGPMMLGAMLTLPWILFAALWPLLRGVSWEALRGGLGWYRGQGVLREAGCGIAGYVAGLPVIAIGALAAYVLASRTHTQMSHPIVFSDLRSASGILQIYLLASVFAPLVEETMFRGALFNHLRQQHGWFLSAAISSLLFATVHPQGWAAIPAIGSIGFVLASIREWRGTFIASATAHALNNAVVTTLMILTLR
jgi:membrane protease YdiL (CAAX protease family)